MSSAKPRIALVSPSKGVLTETFIKAHIDYLEGDIVHYHNGFVPKELTGQGRLMRHDLVSRLKRRFSSDDELSADERAFADSLEAEQVDLIFAEYGTTGAELVKVAQSLSLPLVVHFHGYDASQYSTLTKYGERYKIMWQVATTIIVVSQKMKEMLVGMGCPESKMVLAPYGPDPVFFNIDRTPPQSADFLFTGRFVDKKAPYYVLLAFRKLLESGVDARLSMVGDGHLWPAIKNMRDHFGLTEQVELPGAVPHEEVRRRMADAACYIQHSIRAESGDMEGTPVSIIEAAAAGLPVVATRHAGIPDVILHGETGLLVDEHDVEGMVAQMRIIATELDKAYEMGLASRERVRGLCSREENIGILNGVIRSAASK